MALNRRIPTRGIKQRIKLPDRREQVSGPFLGTMQAGPARPKRAHGLSDEHQDRGLLYVEKAIWDDAIKEFEKSVELSPDFSEGWNNLGLCQLYAENIDAGIKALNEAIRHFPGWHIALANLGLAFQKSKKNDQAANYYRQSVTKTPKQPQVWAAMGEVLEVEGKADEAATAYRSALTHAPKYDNALYRLGMLLARRTELDEAEKHLRGALEQNPQAADVAGVLGAIAARRGQLEAAREYFSIAQSASPDRVPATASRGMAALDFFEQGIQRNLSELMSGFGELPSVAECMYNAGLAYMKVANHSMARTAFQGASDEDAQWVDPLVFLGLVEALEKNPLEARKHWDAVRKLDPNNAVVVESLGLTSLAMGLNKEADKNFEEARKLGRSTALPSSSAHMPAQAG